MWTRKPLALNFTKAFAKPFCSRCLKIQLNSDFENIQPTMNTKNYDSKKSMQENFNEDSLDDQTRCFVLGYN